MKRNLLALLMIIGTFMFSYQIAQAAWVEHHPTTVTQPDGEVIHCFVTGDENYHWVHDENGYTLIRDPQTGVVVYATLLDDELVPTSYRVGMVNPALVGLQPKMRASASKQVPLRSSSNGSEGEMYRAGQNNGTFNNLVIYIRFADQGDFFPSANAHYSMFNDENSPSLYKYFKELSYNQTFIISHFPQHEPGGGNDIYSYQDEYIRDYYLPHNETQNLIGYTNDKAARKSALQSKACQAVVAQYGVNLSDYQRITYIVRGPADAWSELLWSTGGGSSTFIMEGQLSLGTLAHEFLHTFGAPDLYRYPHFDVDGVTPVGLWDVMADTQGIPQSTAMLIKLQCGWIDEIPEITHLGTYCLNNVWSDANNAFKIASPYSSTEYFVIEYRDNTISWDSSMPGCGLIIYRVNKTTSGNAQGPPDEIYIYRLNGAIDNDGDLSSAYFSDQSGRTQFTDAFTSNPRCFLSNGMRGGIKIKNIGPSCGSTMCFDVVGDCESYNYSGGNGSSGNPYQISTYQDLKCLADFVNAGYGRQTIGVFYKLTNDIDFEESTTIKGWKPIGTIGEDKDFSFMGNFNGNGHIIENFIIKRSDENFVGLFGSMIHATVTDLGVINCDFIGKNWVGMLAGASDSCYISNCYTTGIVTGNSIVGGLVGAANIEISSCYSIGIVNGNIAGGLVGSLHNYGEVMNCYAEGKVRGDTIGGLVGRTYNNTIIANSYSTCSVIGTNNYAGGLIGMHNFYINNNISDIIRNCVAANDSVVLASNNNNINRIAGFTNADGKFYNNYAYNGMVVQNSSGGIYTGEGTDLAGRGRDWCVLKTFRFYNTGGNWNFNIPWSISRVQDPTKIWKICEIKELPKLQWQETNCTPFIIAATAGSGGIIIPAGNIIIANCDTTFTFRPDPCFEIDQVYVDGLPVTIADSTYRFTNIDDNHTIHVTFKRILYTVTATATAGGTITPNGPTSVYCGTYPTFTFFPANCSEIDRVIVNGIPITNPGNSYTFNNVKGDSTIHVSFKSTDYLITASAGPNGYISPGNTIVNCGANQTFTFYPSNCYEVDEVFVNDFPVSFIGNSYTFNNVQRNNTIYVTFKKIQYTITSSAGANGSISPNGFTTVECGEIQTYTFIPDPCYEVDEVLIDGTPIVISGNNYTFDYVVSDYSISVSFKIKEYTINAISGVNGAISSSGVNTVECGDNMTFFFTPDYCYKIDQVSVDGVPVTISGNSYTFVNIQESHTISVSFSMIEYIITATAGPNGTITPAGLVPINCGADRTFIFSPDPLYEIEQVWVDGVFVHAAVLTGTYTFNNVLATHTISVFFAPKTYTITVEGNPTEGGVPTGAGYEIDYGTEWTVHANPTSIYYFLYWTDENDVVVSYNEDYTFTVEESRHLTAHYSLIYCNVKVSPNPPEGGVATGGANFIIYGTVITVSAIPNAPLYKFIDWTENGIRVSTSEDYTFAVTENRILVANFEIVTFEVNLIPDPISGGWVEGGGNNIPFGTEITIYAYPYPNYYFTGWTETDGTLVSFEDVYDFPVTESRTLIAHFELIKLDVILSAYPTEGGTVSANGINIPYGDDFTASAFANPTYVFVNWTENGVQVSTSPNYTFPVTQSRVLVANFELVSYNITLLTNPPGAGIVTGGGNYPHGTQIVASAVAEACATFVNWTEGGVPVCVYEDYPFAVTGDRTLVANFDVFYYDITVSADPTAGGIVSGGGTHIACGTEITVSATAESCYTFENWIENGTAVSTDEDYTFVVSEDRDLVAHFTIKEYEITLAATPITGGTVLGDGIFDCDTEITVSAIHAPGFVFVKWTENGLTVATTENYTFFVTEDRDLVAHFEPGFYTITVTGDPLAGGVPTGAGTHITYGTNWTIDAHPNLNYVFSYWSDDDGFVSALENYSFDVTKSHNFIAHYVLETFTVDLEPNPAEGGSVFGEGVYDYGTLITVSAVANSIYQFVNWTENGVVVHTLPDYTFPVTENRELVANFVLIPYTITLLTQPLGAGTVTGGGVYAHGTSITVSATANECATFVNWTENGIPVSINPNYPFAVTADRTLVANFEVNSSIITLSADPIGGGTVSGGGDNMACGTEITVSATANPCYTFVNWTEAGVVVSTDENYTFIITGDRELVAHFIVDEYEITLTASPLFGGSVSGGGTQPCGEEITVTATPVPGFIFINWTENGLIVATTENYTFIVTEDRDLVAHFEPGSFTITVDADPITGGLPTGAGTHIIYGTEWTIYANPFTYYNFLYWTDDDGFVSYDANYTFEVTKSHNFVAHYELKSFFIYLEPIPAEGGTVFGEGTYEYGTVITVLAVANTLYRFIDWTENGERVSTSEDYTFIVTEDRNLVANFELINLWVNLIPEPIVGGWVEGGGNNIPFGTEITIYAYPFPNYYFVNWTEEDGTLVSSTAIFPFTVTESRTLIAHFELIKLDVILWANPPHGGTVSPNGYNITYGDEFTASAFANPNYVFVNWTENDEEVYTLPDYSFPVLRNRVLTANFELKTFNILLSSNPPDAGTVTGGGTNIPHGTEIEVTATPGECAHFLNWTENGIVVCVDPIYPFTVIGDRELVANFEMDPYAVTLSADPVAGGTPSGGGTDIPCLTEVTVSANPDACYIFENWTEDGLEVSTEEDYTFILTGDRNLVAHYIIKEYEITLSAFPSTDGTVGGGGAHPCGDQITVTAYPEQGFRFVKWTEYGITVEIAENYTFVVEEDRELVAHFEAELYTITVTPDQILAGVPVASGAHIVYGTEWTIEARPNTNYTFLYWTDDDGTVYYQENYSFTVTKSQNFVAHYELKTYEILLDAIPGEGGTVVGEGNYVVGTILTVTAIENANYDFIEWTDEDGTFITSNHDYTFVVVSNRHLLAHFGLKKFTVTLLPNPSQGGSVIGGDTDISFGTVITIEAIPNYNFDFFDWTEEDGSFFSPLAVDSFSVTRDLVLYANFFPKTYNIITSASPGSSGSVTPSMYNVPFDTVVTVIAEAYPNYVFVDWTEEILPGFSYPQEEYTFPVHRSRNLVANFALQTYNINLTASPNWGGNVSGGGNFPHNTTITVSAAPEQDYVFIEWRENGVFVDHNPNYTFSVICSRNLTAIFRLDSINVVVVANPLEGGTVIGGGTGFHYGELVTVSAFPDDCYDFVNWTVDGVEVANTPDYTFPATEHVTLVANFEIKKYNIVLSAIPSAGGTVTGGDNNIHCGTEITITATPDECYSFVNWTLNGNVFSTNPSVTIEVTENLALVAHFVIFQYDVELSANPPQGGTVSGSIGLSNIHCGTEITVTAVPHPEATFINWTEDGIVVCQNPVYTFSVTASRNLVANFVMNRYTIILIPNIIQGGFLDGAGTYDWGEPITVLAVPNQFHNFIGWTENDIPVEPDATYSFNVERDRTLTAHFEEKTYTVTVTPNSTIAGAAWGGATGIALNETITVHAEAFEHFTFANWTENGIIRSTQEEYSFVVTQDCDLVANFTLETFDVFVTASPSDGGMVNGGGYNLPFGTTHSVTATPNLDYVFVEWRENDSMVSVSPIYYFYITHTRHLVAHFELKDLSVVLSANPHEGGTVEGGGNNIPSGTMITVTATPNDNYVFVNWTEEGYGIVSTYADYTFPVTRNRNLVANFSYETFNITLAASPPSGGTVSGGGYDIEYGTEITVIATANPFHTFESWTENGVVVCVDTAFTFTVTKSRSLIANFNGVTYPITLISNPLDGGILSGGGDIPHGTELTVIAESNLGFAFVNWTEGYDNVVVSNTPDYTFTVEGPRTLVANFIMKNHDIFVVASPDEGGTVSGGGINIPNGQIITISATPTPEWYFIHWTKNGVEVSTEADYTFPVTESCTFVAKFAKEIYTITVIANPPEYGTVYGGGTFTSGTDIAVTAISGNLFSFVNWTEEGNEVSVEEDYAFTVDRSRVLVANFEKTRYLVNVSVNDSDYGTAIGGGWYDKNATALVEAIEKTGFLFVNWTIDGDVVSREKIYEFVVTENVNLVANFYVLDFDKYASTLWDNTFMLNLKKLADEGYEVTGCKWFKNGKEQKNTNTINQFSYSAGPDKTDLLELAPTYYMYQITTEKHGTLYSTKKMLTRYLYHVPPKPNGLVVYPNPANSGDSFTIENTIEEYPIEVYNQYGVCVKRAFATDNITTLTLDLPTGLYLLRNNDKETKIVIVGK